MSNKDREKRKEEDFEALLDAVENPIEDPRDMWSDNFDGEKKESEALGEKLTARQRRFCQLYATDSDFFGNWVQAYLEVYDIDKSKPRWYQTACSAASDLLSNPKVCAYINSMLTLNGFNDEFMDKQLLAVATQHSDYGSKVAAIREYNKIKGRIKDKIEHSVNIESIVIK